MPWTGGQSRLNVTQRFNATREGRLYLAAKEGDIEGAAAACAEGAALHTLHPEFGSTPVIIAVLHSHTECVHCLLEEKAALSNQASLRMKVSDRGCFCLNVSPRRSSSKETSSVGRHCSRLVPRVILHWGARTAVEDSHDDAMQILS